MAFSYDVVATRHRQRTQPAHSQIQQARLANILDFGAGCTDLGLFESRTRSRIPSEDGEWSSADLLVDAVRGFVWVELQTVA
jgi:hypothetical protein